MSREVYGCGGYPVLTKAENQRLHCNVMGVYRRATSEHYSSSSGGKSENLLADGEVLKVHDLRAPLTVVRFARLRLSVRIICSAPFELLAVLFHSKADTRSWLAALVKDIAWLSLCLPDVGYTFQQWCGFVRSSPKAARTLIRRACDSVRGQSLVLGQTCSAVTRYTSLYSCWCGQVFHSSNAYIGHQVKAHGMIGIASWYAQPSNVCQCCLLRFCTRRGLVKHLKWGKGICLLNSLLRVPTVAPVDMEAALAAERLVQAKNVAAGLPRFHAAVPPFRMPGPILPIVDFQGDVVGEKSPLHPYGPQKKKYVYKDDNED